MALPDNGPLNEVALTVPVTSSSSVGAAFPIPTFPAPLIIKAGRFVPVLNSASE